jgi:hypothetical protein
MKKLSEQLSDLSDRAKRTEDVIDAARTKDRARIEAQKAALTSSVAAGKARVAEGAGEAKSDVQSKWNDARDSLDARFATIRANAEERRTERDLKRAEHRADAAEQDAADAVDFALYVLDQTEYAILDAAVARADADDLALNS